MPPNLKVSNKGPNIDPKQQASEYKDAHKEDPRFIQTATYFSEGSTKNPALYRLKTPFKEAVPPFKATPRNSRLQASYEDQL